MNINDYLDLRNTACQIRGVSSLFFCFTTGLEYLDHQSLPNGAGFEFAPQSLPALRDWKAHIAQLIKTSFLTRGTLWHSCKDFEFDPGWSEAELDRAIENSLQNRLDAYLLNPGLLKPCVYGVDYQLEDLVEAIEQKLEES